MVFTTIHSRCLKEKKRHFTHECLWWGSYFTISQSLCFFNIASDEMWSTHEHSYRTHEKKHLYDWVVSWTNHFHRTQFSLERMTDKQWLFQLVFLIDVFSKKNEESLSFQGKHRTVFIASDKIQAFKQKLEFCKTCIHHCEPDSFLTVFWWGWWWY